MNRLCVTVLPALLLLATLVAGENPPASPPSKFTVDLVDGSSLIGSSSLTSIEIQSSLGKMNVPVQKIQNLTMDKDHETALILFENGDKLTGRLTLKNFKLTTVLGELSVDLALLRRMGKFSSEEQKLRELLDTPEKKRQLSSTILNECRQVDAAKDQYALENNKTGTVTPNWNDLTPYLKAGSPLMQNGGMDSLGNPFMIQSISERLMVNPKTKAILQDATGGDTFWGPYS